MVLPASVQVAADDVLTIDLETPNGLRYQRMEMPVAPAGSAETELSLKGYPFPVKAQALKPSEDSGKKTQIVEVRLPAAGTAITESGFHGQWLAEAWLSSASA